MGVIIRTTKNKRHFRNLYFYFNRIKSFLFKQSLPLLGFKCKVAGRLGGRMRKSWFIFKLGKTGLTSFFLNIKYANDFVVTQYGVFSTKC